MWASPLPSSPVRAKPAARPRLRRCLQDLGTGSLCRSGGPSPRSRRAGWRRGPAAQLGLAPPSTRGWWRLSFGARAVLSVVGRFLRFRGQVRSLGCTRQSALLARAAPSCLRSERSQGRAGTSQRLPPALAPRRLSSTRVAAWCLVTFWSKFVCLSRRHKRRPTVSAGGRVGGRLASLLGVTPEIPASLPLSLPGALPWDTPPCELPSPEPRGARAACRCTGCLHFCRRFTSVRTWWPGGYVCLVSVHLARLSLALQSGPQAPSRSAGGCGVSRPGFSFWPFRRMLSGTSFGF